MIRGSITWTDKKVILLILLILFLGFYIGYASGTFMTIKTIAKIGSSFIDVDEKLIKLAIYQYENFIGDCFPPNWTI